MDSTLSLLQIISAAFIVPLVDVIKKRFLPADWSFLSWALQALLCFGFAYMLSTAIGEPHTTKDIITATVTLMAGASGIHAVAKTYKKVKGE